MRYPWTSWFKQREFTLLKGRDFHIETDMMVQSVYNNASRLGKSVKLKVAGDSLIIRVSVLEGKV